MRRHVSKLLIVAGMVCLAAGGWAQASGSGSGSGATPAQGFSVNALINQLSLYLPPEATQGLRGGYGNRTSGQGTGGGQNAQGGSGQAGSSQTGQSSGRVFPQVQFTRDPKLYLTKDQISKLLDIFTGLKENPMPSPSKAKQIQAQVDAILTPAQKTEFTNYRSQMQKAMEQFRQQMSANGGGASSANGSGGQGSSGQYGSQNGGQNGSTPQVSTLQVRQRQVDAFIKVLQDRQSQLSG